MAAQKAGPIEGDPGRLASGALVRARAADAARGDAGPTAWGPYVLGRRIGRGAMGVVHAAMHRNAAGIARLVAVKILVADRADHPEEREAFLREARILARLDHPNVVRWLDAGEIGGDVFIAMELLHGASLAQVVAASPERLPLPVAISVLADLARGLHAAHDLRDETGQPLGLVHQDVSPQNAVVGYDGRTRLVDFGIARLASVDASRTDTVRGKPAYLAPEQLEGRRLDRRTDVFALGVIAFEILAGRRLFARGSIAETHTAVLFEPIPDLCDVRPELPADLAAVVSCALSRSPGGRFNTAEAFRRALLAARDDARIPAADEREIADLVAARVPAPWQSHELFAEIEAGSAGAAKGPSGEAPSSPELSQAVTIAPRRERSVPDPTDEPTRAPARERPAAIVGLPSNAAEAPGGIVGLPSNAAEAPGGMVGLPSNSARPGGGEALPEIPMSRASAWLRGVFVAGTMLLVLVAVILGRRTVRAPAALGGPSASAGASGEVPRKRADGAPDEPPSSPLPPSSSGNKGAPVRAGGTAGTPSLPGATAPTGTLGSPASPGSGASAQAAPPTAAPVLPAATSAPLPAVEPPSNGWISVWSTPWGRVRVDGRDVGDSPVIRVTAPPGPHTVSVKSEAGEQARSVGVKSGEESKVRFVF